MRYIWGVFALIVLGLLAFGYFHDTNSATSKDIAAALAIKYAKPASAFVVTVATDTGLFARGSVSYSDEPGGGVWFASKKPTGWQLAYDGNGIIPCNIADQYAFPAEIVPQCIDTQNNNALLQREGTSTVQEPSFSAVGVVTRNNPGQKADVWYLIYERPGAPALSVELDLNAATTPYIELSQGERVYVSGTLRDDTLVVQQIQAAPAGSMGIKLYFYDPSLDQGPGGAQCSSQGLVAVDRILPETATPLADSIRLLLKGEITGDEKTRGITSEFPLPGVTLKSATIANGIATLTFDDPQHKTSGGSCRVSILQAELEATAKQFPTVQSVHFMPEELFQP